MKLNSCLRLAACAALWSVTATLSLAGPWPSWRGPSDDQSAAGDGYPVRWTASENVRWRTPLPEPGNSSPVVWGDTVFVTQALEDGHRRTVMAFDRATGRLRWQSGVRHDADDPRHETNPHCAASPVTDGERVVASFGSAGVVAYDFAGKELWRADLGPQRHTWGQGSSPILHGDQVLVYHGPGPDSALVALDKRSGVRRWSVRLPEVHPPERFDGFAGKNDGMMGSFATPLVVRAGNRDEIILPVSNRLRAFSVEDGRELWSAGGMNPLVYSSPTLGEGTLVAYGGFFGGVVFIRPGGEGDVTDRRLFHERRMRKHTIGSPVIHEGHVYLSVTDGFLQCYELGSGKMVFEERLPATGATGQTWGSLVRVGDRLYVVNQGGDTVVLRAAPRFEVLAVNPVGEPSNATPAFSDGEIFLRTQTSLICVGGDAASAGRR